MSYNFWILIFVQCVIFLFLYIRNKGTSRDITKVLFLSACAGLVGGFVFDILFGSLGVFTYHGLGLESPVSRTGLSWYELIYNDVFSYGLAVATARYITKDVTLEKKTNVKKSVTLFLGALVILSILLSLGIDFSLLSLFVYGIGVIALGEGVLALNKQSGPLLFLYMNRDYAPMIKLWSDVVVVALLYEVANYFFPFWVWLPSIPFSYLGKEFLITVFGYAMLFHLMIVFWQRLSSKK